MFSLKGTRLDPAGRMREGSYIQLFAAGAVYIQKPDNKMSPGDAFDFKKMLMCGSPEMDEEGWHGRFVAEVGPRREVKARAFPPDPDRDLQEVRLEDPQP